jgi:pimeloyl-ACP methyl ester carboxylesterase
VGLSPQLAIICTIILFIPALTGALAWLENLRSGEADRQRALLGGRVAPGLVRAFANSVWTLWLTVFALPLGSLLGFRCAGTASAKPPVILVHGLYHNPAAWFVWRWRLRRRGFTDLRCYGYPSFGREFADIAKELAAQLRQTAEDSEHSGTGGRVLLIGHSLGGLIIRAACAEVAAEAGGAHVAGVVTLGTPHRGSTLAGLLGIGRLARGLAPGGRVIQAVRKLPCAPGPGLSLYTPTDGMVLPLSGALLDERERCAGWTERALPAMSHVGLLYSAEAARQVLAFLEEASGREVGGKQVGGKELGQAGD